MKAVACRRPLLSPLRAVVLASMIAAAACSSAPAEDIGTTSAALVSPCGTPLGEVDGVHAYSNGINTDTGYSCGGVTAVGASAWQCVELAQRYMNKRFGILALWPVDYAAQMCRANPAGTVTHWAGDGYAAKKGDLTVWGTNFGGGYGHVAVVRRVVSGGVEILEQNSSLSPNGIRTLTGGPNSGYGGAACVVTATANTGSGGVSGGGGGPTSTCGFGDGLYCGGNGGGSNKASLYRCSNGAPAAIETCARGCEWMADLQDDRCRASAACPYGEGMYCGGNGISGDGNVLFECRAGAITAAQRCSRGCMHMTTGLNDKCAP